MLIPINYNIRSLFVRKTTTFATALGIALVVFVLASSLMLSEGIKRTMSASGQRDVALVLRAGSDTELASGYESRQASIVAAAPGVKMGSDGQPLTSGEAVIVITLGIVGTDGQVANVQVRGVPPQGYALRPNLQIIEGRRAQPGTDEVIIGKSTVSRYDGMRVGSSFELKKNRPVQVVGVFSDAGSSHESEIWGDIDTVRTSFGREGLVSGVTVQLESAAAYDAFEAAVEGDKQLGLEVFRQTEYFEKNSQGTSLFITFIGSFIAVLFSVGAMIGATITMNAAVAQRRREIGTLRALGFSRFAILLAFLLEAVVLSILGGLAGLVASLSMGLVSISMMNFQTWQEVTFSFQPTFGIMGIALLFGGVMGVLGGFLPAVRASRVSVLEALRD
jgi:putative ABC transport system permease protein